MSYPDYPPPQPGPQPPEEPWGTYGPNGRLPGPQPFGPPTGPAGLTPWPPPPHPVYGPQIIPIVPLRRNGMGTAALVLGILGLLTATTVMSGQSTPDRPAEIFGYFLFPVAMSVLPIIFGTIGLNRVSRGEATNGGAAQAGRVMGIVGTVIVAIALITTVIASG